MDDFTKQCNEALLYVCQKLYEDFGITVEPQPYSNDLVTCIATLPRGVVVELFGEKGIGKTTIALTIVRNLQEQRKNTLYVDFDKTLFGSYMERMNIRGDGLLILNPSDVEEGLRTLCRLVASGTLDFIIVDSAYHIPASTMYRHLKELVPMLGKSRTTVLFLNEYYKTIYNRPVIPGGDALKFAASVRLHITIVKKFKNVDGHYGNRVIIRSVKDRHGFVYTEEEFKVYFGKGVVRENIQNNKSY